ncbi:acyl carrier protein [Paenibacillus sp. KS-LC4]|uniref:acyl carrier protein n=1 Tax=Paenibacillus sp. KS-LC4 TaxID=2979727 RepID=UPI0030D5D05B
MTRNDMVVSLKNFLVNDLLVETPIEEIRTDMGLASELNVDSLGFTEIMAHLEDEYNIRISDEEFIPENFKNIDALINLVESKK